MCCTTTTNKKCTQNDKYECLDSLGGLIVANFDTSFQFIFLVWEGRGYEGLSEPRGEGGHVQRAKFAEKVHKPTHCGL